MTDPEQRPEERGPEDRLESWKEIAAYLKRDVRTVQRWEKSEELPVYRHVHNSLATVYAYKPEIDAWWNNRRPKLEKTRPSGRRLPRRVQLAVVGLVVALASAVLSWIVVRRPSSEARSPIALRRVPGPENLMIRGLPSPDGRFLSFTTVETGDLALFELATGDTRRLTDKGTWEESSDQAVSSSV